MVQMGHLQSWFGAKVRRASLHVPAATSCAATSALLSSLYMFPNLTSLSLGFDRADHHHHHRGGGGGGITQGIFCSLAELRGLRACHLRGGTMSVTGISLEASGAQTKRGAQTTTQIY